MKNKNNIKNKEGNEFPNIKVVKLEEEENKDNNNSSKIKIKRYSNYKGIKYCFLYFILFSMIIIAFALNYLNTKDAFKDNKYITLPSEILCNKTIKILEECMKTKNVLKCQYESKAVEHCYDESYTLNQVCFVYISELELCMRKNNNDNKKCGSKINDVIKCSSIYRHLHIEKDYLKDIMKYR